MTVADLVHFRCPACHAELRALDVALECSGCRRSYSVVDGIPSFVEEDSFYEGKWADTDWSAGSTRNLLVKKERFFVQELRGRRGSVLDLGCGGGWKLYTRVGSVTGVDVSLASLRRARGIYAHVARTRLTALPFRDESFDFIVSCDVLGHVPPGEKDAVLREIYRLLKRGGRTLHYVEADGDDPLVRFAKRYPELYQRHFLAPEGHVGLETAQETMCRFRRTGLRAVREIASYRGMTYVGRLLQYFDNEYSAKSRAVRGLVAACKAITALKPLEIATNLGISVLVEVGDGVLPASWSGGVMVSYEKP